MSERLLWTSGPENMAGLSLSTLEPTGELVLGVRSSVGPVKLLIRQSDADQLHAALTEWLAL